MTRRRARLVGWTLVIASSAALAAAVSSMAARLREHNRAVAAPLWWLERAEEPAFEYEGRELRIEPTPGADGAAAGVRVVWGGARETLPIGGRVIEQIPDLKRYEEWLAVVRMASGTAASEVEAKTSNGAERARLLVVARTPAEGYNPETWGQARYKDWGYVFLELQADGSIERSEATYRQLERDPRSWRFAAAMQVTPGLFTPGMRASSPLTYPNYGPIREAFRAMGWTWAASGVAALTLIAGGLLVASASVRRGGLGELDEGSGGGADSATPV